MKLTIGVPVGVEAYHKPCNLKHGVRMAHSDLMRLLSIENLRRAFEKMFGEEK
jgi:hypothetical protein